MIDPILLSSALVALVITPMMAPALAQQGQRGAGPASAQGVTAPEISGFSVVLVVGETQSSGGGNAAQDLPAGAQRALADMREFLPYKHYRVLDTQWTSCCSPRHSARVSGRLHGVGGLPGPNNSVNLVSRTYAFNITAGTATPTITTRFVLMLEETGRAVSAERLRELERERQDLKAEIETAQMQLSETQRRIEVGAVSAADALPLRNRVASLQRKLTDTEQMIEEAGTAGGRPIIDSSFTMTAGETVVVGTSKLGGDKALIALVTAVTKNTSSRKD